MKQLAQFLSIRLGRPVEDRTGLDGRYDFDLSWTPDDNEVDALGNTFPPTAAATGASLSAALKEQLGLQLTTGKSKLEVFVIDHAEKPQD